MTTNTTITVLTKPSNEAQIVKLLNEKEASIYCGMSVSFLQKSRSNGQLGNRTKGPVFKKIGRRVLYDIKDLDEWSNSFKSYNHLAEMYVSQNTPNHNPD